MIYDFLKFNWQLISQIGFDDRLPNCLKIINVSTYNRVSSVKDENDNK